MPAWAMLILDPGRVLANKARTRGLSEILTITMSNFRGTDPKSLLRRKRAGVQLLNSYINYSKGIVAWMQRYLSKIGFYGSYNCIVLTRSEAKLLTIACHGAFVPYPARSCVAARSASSRPSSSFVQVLSDGGFRLHSKPTPKLVYLSNSSKG